MLHIKGGNPTPLNQVHGNPGYPKTIENFQIGESEEETLIRGVRGYNSGYYGLASIDLNGTIGDEAHDWNLRINNEVHLSVGTVPPTTTEEDLNITQLGKGRWELRHLKSLDGKTDELIMNVLRDIGKVGGDFIWDLERDDGGVLGHSGSTTRKMKQFFRDRFTNSEVIKKAINKISTDLVLAIRDKA